MLILNPGSGAIPNTTEAQAVANMQQFVADLGFGQFERHLDVADGKGGRYSFRLQHQHQQVELAMPGCPLDNVRPEHSDQMSSCYRLYLNGCSWYWAIALDLAQAKLKKS